MAFRQALPRHRVRYLAASRQIWNRAISASADHHWLWYGDRSGLTIEGVLRRLTVPGAAVEAPLAALGFPRAVWGEALAPADRDRLRAWLQGPEFAAAAAAPRAANRARLLAHLAQEGLFDGTPQAIVDLGWSGSLHDALSGLLAAEGAGPVECYLFGIERVADATWLDRRHGYYFDHNRGIGADIFARACDQRGFLEVFCAADHGTVTGLRETADGRIEPEVDPTWAGPVAAWGLGTVRAAIAAFAESLAGTVGNEAGPEAVTADDILALRPAIGALLRDFWLDPAPAEARAWGAFPFNLGEGHGSYVAPLADAYGPADLARVLKGRRMWKKHENFWIEGAVAASNPALRRLLATARRLRQRRRAGA